MSLTLTIRSIQIITASSLSKKDKDYLTSTLNQALDWTEEYKAKYDQAIMEWDENHPRIQKTLPDGRKIWVETNLKD